MNNYNARFRQLIHIHNAGFPLENFFEGSEIFFWLYPISSRSFQLRDQRQMKNRFARKNSQVENRLKGSFVATVTYFPLERFEVKAKPISL
jgi:hypothetical protein